MLPAIYDFENNFYENIPTKLYVFAIGKLSQNLREILHFRNLSFFHVSAKVQLVLTFDVPKQFHIVQHTLPIARTVDYQMSGRPGVIGMYSWA
jgi:hypothetical protein